ncbi:MAG: zinc ribbon domain-containing protein [Chloroflexota bacterium]|nr:zinc ribbon domain-containing protein [Chloroflexota bacterium]
MPTYEYLCQACSHRFETWQKMIEDPLTICPECGGHIRRVLYPAGIVFKGSGFYKTDHGNSALPPSNGSNGETKPTEEKSGESKSTESKPAENGHKSTTASDSPASTPAATS